MPTVNEQLEEIKARHKAATPGPWWWFGNTGTHSIGLATINRGRIAIMDFFRWGMCGATPAFQNRGRVTLAEDFVRYEVSPHIIGKKNKDETVYREDFHEIVHPDAEFIARSWEDVDFLLAEIGKLKTRNEFLEKEILEATGEIPR